MFPVFQVITVIEVILVGVWIYLVFMVRKKKAKNIPWSGRTKVNRETLQNAENIPVGRRNIVGGGYCWYRSAWCTRRSVGNRRRACLFLHRACGSLRVLYSNYWRPVYTSQRRTKNNIKEYRNKYNLTQGKLAEMPGVRRETIIFLE